MTLPIGIHYNVPAADYHADPCERPSLSSSVAKILLEKTPRHAWTAHPRLNPDFAPKQESKFDLGSAVHELMLGKGVGYTVINAADYKSKDAQQARQKAREAGAVPLLAEQYKQAVGIAKEAFDSLAEMDVNLPDHRNEAVLIWEEHGLPCRAMIDSIGRGIHQIWDIKTTSAGLSEFAVGQTIARYNYDLSAAFYIRGYETLFKELTGRIEFNWIFVDTEPPYEIGVFPANATTLEFGRRKVEAALTKWAACMELGMWPGYPREPRKYTYPSWAESAWLEREMQEAGIE
jgi:hypothetical protein